jgi:hypothetical protein
MALVGAINNVYSIYIFYSTLNHVSGLLYNSIAIIYTDIFHFANTGFRYFNIIHYANET